MPLACIKCFRVSGILSRDCCFLKCSWFRLQCSIIFLVLNVTLKKKFEQNTLFCFLVIAPFFQIAQSSNTGK